MSPPSVVFRGAFDRRDDRDVRSICDDLTAEHDALDAIVATLDDATWSTATPAPGWSIVDQISHLWFFDGTALLAATDVAAFEESKQRLLSGGDVTDPAVAAGRAMSPSELLASWRRDRHSLVETFRTLDPSARLPWYGPAMAARSFATARLMETWAHGQDVADALGVSRPATDRLRHVAHIGVRARPFSYAINDRTMPTQDVRVELCAPSGDLWTWGDEASSDVVTGDALDFCLVVTQRRHPSDTALSVSGAGAQEWISFAQAFAGGPGQGRAPGQFQSTTDR